MALHLDCSLEIKDQPRSKAQPMSELEDGEILDDSISTDFKAEDLDAESEEEIACISALPVASFNETFCPNSTPMTGEQYLCLVRHERSRLPRVRTAGNLIPDPKSIPDLTIPSNALDNHCPAELRPDKEWQESVLSQFYADKRAFEEFASSEIPSLPSINDEVTWKAIVEADEQVALSVYSLTLLGRLRLLLYISRWSSSSLQVSSQYYAWAYMLLVALEMGLCSDGISILRSLAKTCIRLRSVQVEPYDWPSISQLNAIITIVGLVYNQKDLLL